MTDALRPGRVRDWVAPGLAAATATAIATTASIFPLDDAYITLQNARALIGGGWDATYGVSALTGATSLVHLLLVALAGLMLPLPAALWLVSIAGVAAYAAGLDRMAVQAGVSRITVGAAGLLTGYMTINLVNGLETGVALAAMTWTLVLIDHRRLPLLLGALPFIRPEFAALSLPLLARCCWRDRSEPKRMAANLLWFGAGALPFLALTWGMTGRPFPATANAKVAFFAEAQRPLQWKIEIAARLIVISGLGALLIGQAGLPKKRGGLAITAFLLLWLGTMVYSFPGGLDHNYSRYLTLIVPAAVYGATALMRGRYGRVVSSVLLTWALLSSALGLVSLEGAFGNPNYRALGADAALLPPGARVLVHDAGYLAWVRPDLHLVDLVGLKTPSSAAAHARYTAPTADPRQALDSIVRASNARLLVALAKEPFWRLLPENLVRAGWTLERINPATHGYAIYRLTPPPTTGYAAP